MKYTIIIILLFSYSLSAERAIPGLENSRMNFDFSSRSSYNDRQSQWSFQHFIGLELYQVFSTQNRDIGNLLLQPYIHRIDNGTRTPGYYDDNHDTEFIWRTAAFTFTGLGNQLPWLKVGHFEVPFGVEYTKNTFGNLHQYGQARKLGLKVDWGFALGQQLEDWQYEVSVTRGSGLEYRDRQKPYAFSGRISTLNDSVWCTGLSFYKGEILKGEVTQDRELIAWDIQSYLNTFGLLAEFNVGTIDQQDTWGALVEVNWSAQDERFMFYQQFHYQDLSANNQYSAAVTGAKYHLNQRLTLSIQGTFELNKLPNDVTANLFEFQIRYNF